MTATNRDLKRHRAGTFREDLFLPSERGDLRTPVVARPNGGHPPALHAGDVAVRQEFGKEVLDIEPEAQELLQRYNILEISANCRNIIERAMILCHDKA